MPPPAFTRFDFEIIFLVHLYSMLGETPPSMFSSPRIVRWPWLVLKSWNLRGMGKKDMCPLGQTLRLWNLSHTPQLPKPESASGLNARSLRWHLGFQNGGGCKAGGAMRCDHHPALCTLQRTGLKCSSPNQLPVSSFLTSSLLGSFPLVLWDREDLKVWFIFFIFPSFS